MHEKHGHTRERLYRVWTQMRYRCLTPTCPDYHHYGGRGIGICPEWGSYPAFRQWALANGYEPGLQIDRRDNDQGYSPDNCRWVTSEKTISAWARDPRCSVAEVTLWQRVQRGMAHEAAILTPNHRGRRNDLLTSGPTNDYREAEPQKENHQ